MLAKAAAVGACDRVTQSGSRLDHLSRTISRENRRIQEIPQLAGCFIPMTILLRSPIPLFQRIYAIPGEFCGQAAVARERID